MDLDLTNFATASSLFVLEPHDVRFASINVDVHDAGRLGAAAIMLPGILPGAGISRAARAVVVPEHQEPGRDGSPARSGARNDQWQSRAGSCAGSGHGVRTRSAVSSALVS